MTYMQWCRQRAVESLPTLLDTSAVERSALSSPSVRNRYSLKENSPMHAFPPPDKDQWWHYIIFYNRYTVINCSCTGWMYMYTSHPQVLYMLFFCHFVSIRLHQVADTFIELWPGQLHVKLASIVAVIISAEKNAHSAFCLSMSYAIRLNLNLLVNLLLWCSAHRHSHHSNCTKWTCGKELRMPSWWSSASQH